MSVFVLVSGGFMWRARRALKRAGLVGFAVVFGVATLLVYLRTIFRLAETAEGLFGTLQTHEVYFAVLEFAPVAAAVGLFAGWHPGRYLGVRKGKHGDGKGGNRHGSDDLEFFSVKR